MTDDPRPAPPAGGLTFRARLVLGVCGLVLGTGLLVLWLAHASARRSTDALTGALFREVSASAATRTRSYVLRAAPVVESLAGLADRGLAIDDHDRLVPQLLAVLKANPGLTWVSYGDEAGTFTGVYRSAGMLLVNRSKIDAAGRSTTVEAEALPDGTTRPVRTLVDDGYDPRKRPFYLKAKAADRLVWLPPYIFVQQGIPGVTCCAPVRDAGGTFRGVLTADFDLIALSGFANELAVSANSRVFLYTDDGVLLARPGVGEAARDVTRTELPTLAGTGDPVVEAYRENLGPAGDRGFRRFDFVSDGVEYYGSETPFAVGDDLTWVVGVAAPKADFAGDVWRTQAVTLAAAAVAVLAAAGVALLLARAVSRPVQALVGFMGRVSDGDLEAKADLGGGTEFRQLADALNRMIADLRDRLRVRHSLGIAMEVQRRLLPAAPPRVPGLDVAGHSTYCDETGGDYFDFVVLDATAPTQVLVVLGDVMGHGVAAALVMAGVRAVLRDRAVVRGDLADLMGRLNRLIAADHDGERFMTMHLSVLDASTGQMRMACAAHDPVIVYDPAADTFCEVGDGDLPLGVLSTTEYVEYSPEPFKPGQVLFLGTDGVWEMPNAAGDQFTKDRLRQVIRDTHHLTAEEMSAALRARLAEFQGSAKSVDDVTFVIIKMLPDAEGPPAPPPGDPPP